jgi:hypothetical protein
VAAKGPPFNSIRKDYNYILLTLSHLALHTIDHHQDRENFDNCNQHTIYLLPSEYFQDTWASLRINCLNLSSFAAFSASCFHAGSDKQGYSNTAFKTSVSESFAGSIRASSGRFRNYADKRCQIPRAAASAE